MTSQFDLSQLSDKELLELQSNVRDYTLVICEILEELKGKSVDTYIQDVIKQKEEKENNEEYELYLKLKEKFEGTEK